MSKEVGMELELRVRKADFAASCGAATSAYDFAAAW